jgi:thiol-disulfide isomerase/thioredoxin
MRRRWLAVAGAMVLAACGSEDSGSSYAATDMVSGEEVSVDSLQGRPALLVSWTTWCTECDEELAGLAAFADSPEAKGIEIVAVNLDAAHVEDEIDAKVSEHGLTTTLWRDRRNEFRSAFGAIGVPTTVLLDADGEVVGTFPGAIDFEDAEVLEALDDLRPS